MNLINYIEKNYKNPNAQILKALGADNKLIEYLLHTPWNTNLNMIDSIGGSESGGSAVVGTAIVGTSVVG